MKKLILSVILLFSLAIMSSCSEESDSSIDNSCGAGKIWVDGYYRTDGTFVHGYCRSK